MSPWPTDVAQLENSNGGPSYATAGEKKIIFYLGEAS